MPEANIGGNMADDHCVRAKIRLYQGRRARGTNATCAMTTMHRISSQSGHDDITGAAALRRR